MELVGGHPDLRHDVVGGEAEGIVDVDDDRLGGPWIETDAVVSTESRIELRRIELGQLDDLDGNVDWSVGVNMVDAEGSFFLAAQAAVVGVGRT